MPPVMTLADKSTDAIPNPTTIGTLWHINLERCYSITARDNIRNYNKRARIRQLLRVPSIFEELEMSQMAAMDHSITAHLIPLPSQMNPNKAEHKAHYALGNDLKFGEKYPCDEKAVAEARYMYKSESRSSLLGDVAFHTIAFTGEVLLVPKRCIWILSCVSWLMPDTENREYPTYVEYGRYAARVAVRLGI
ncbi:MAG: hypothetical protein M1834_006165 [Cirrosporium novae-zelandiae]|nr:MAG: hypothetical protein M1834_006165 [Cirrosporium novae-zelandiae]